MKTTRLSEREHWDNFWDSSAEVDQIYSNEGRVSDRLSDMIPMEGKKVLEVGAGTGRDGIALSRLGAFVVPLDYSSSSLRMIISQIGENSSVAPCCGDGFALPFKEDSFDIVFHQGLLEHFRNPSDMLAENYRVLKPGGYLLVDVPQKYHYYTIVKHIMIAVGKWFAGWETEYTVTELEKLIEQQSFQVVSSYGEWFNPPIWYRMLRKLLINCGLKIPMYPAIFALMGKKFAGFRRWLSRKRWAMCTTVVIGTIAVKE
jgi:ubiquinone/menaquinone biosynthesis C-methylase UbiE